MFIFKTIGDLILQENNKIKRKDINMTKKQEKLFEEQLQKQLKAQFQKGLSDGSKAIAGVIYDKVKLYNGTNAEEVIADIKRFCEVGLAIKENVS